MRRWYDPGLSALAALNLTHSPLSQSHELRTPLSACFGLLGLLAETPLDQEQQDFVQTARSSCELLLDIIDSLLDYSKLEAGQLKLFYSSAPTEDAIADCLELLMPLAVGKGLELSYHSRSSRTSLCGEGFADCLTVILPLLQSLLTSRSSSTRTPPVSDRLCALNYMTPPLTSLAQRADLARRTG